MSLINDALKRTKQTHRQQAVAADSLTVAAAMPPLQPVENAHESGSPSGGATRWLLFLPLLLVLCCLSVWFLWQWGATRNTAAPTLKAASTAASTPLQNEKKNPLQIAAATVAQVKAREQHEPAPTPEVVSERTGLGSSQRSDQTTADELATAKPSASVTAPAQAPAEDSKVTPSARAIVTTASPATQTNSAGFISPIPTATTLVASTEVPTVPLPVPVQAPQPVRPLAPPKFKLQGIFYRIKNPTALINDRIVSVGDNIEGYRIVQIERQSVNLSVPGYTNVVTLY